MSSLSDNQQTLVALRYGFVPKRVSELGQGRDTAVPVRAMNARREIVEIGVLKLSTAPESVYPTFLTTMFLHGGWLHLISNMWILWIFGNNVEDRLGHFMYGCYYLLGGLIATICHWVLHRMDATPLIGASGAVATVLGGYAVTYPWAKVRTLIFVGLFMIVDIPALIWLGIWFVLQNVIPGLLMLGGVIRDPVAYWAHIGGFVAGIALMPLLSLGAPPPESDWHKEAAEMFRFDGSRSS
jgi:membrane associated rhomboid family serine protease